MSPVYVPDCDCPEGKFLSFDTDEGACWELVRRYERFAEMERRLRQGEGIQGLYAHRYWRIHGPGGHLIGASGTPYGDLPFGRR